MEKEMFLKICKNPFAQKVTLLLLAAFIFYLVWPKYDFRSDGAVRVNKITGTVEAYDKYEQKWEKLGSKD